MSRQVSTSEFYKLYLLSTNYKYILSHTTSTLMTQSRTGNCWLRSKFMNVFNTNAPQDITALNVCWNPTLQGQHRHVMQHTNTMQEIQSPFVQPSTYTHPLSSSQQRACSCDIIARSWWFDYRTGRHNLIHLYIYMQILLLLSKLHIDYFNMLISVCTHPPYFTSPQISTVFFRISISTPESLSPLPLLNKVMTIS